MFTLIIFLLVLSVLVLAHEWGHFWTARKFGVRAEEFGWGFPPRVWGIYKNKEGKWKQVWGAKEVPDALDTVYSINLIPFGGFVKIKGENGENETAEDSFAHKKIWQRVIMVSAGVIMNVILAGVFLGIGYMIGVPQALDADISPSAKIENKQIQVIEVLADSPAALAGFEAGDNILAVNGESFDSFNALQEFTKANQDQELIYTLERGDETLDIKATPKEFEDNGEAIIGIGVGLSEIGEVRYPWYLAIYEGFKMAFIYTWLILLAFISLFKDLLLGHGMSAEVAGPVGIAKMASSAARMGVVYLLQFSALLSINLAVLNFLPIPALDGGRVVFLLLEKLRGKPVKKEIEGYVHSIAFLILIILVLIVTFKDVINLF